MSAHHGSTPAAWTGVLIVLVGFVIGGLGLVLESWLLFWVGVACAPLGALVGFSLGKIGFGSEVPVDR
jgi:1,4-dihydroxy-2-naphthoate octaprenyltransferase